MLIKFHKITWNEVVKLAKKGDVGPHVGIDACLLMQNKKPIWLAFSIYEAKNFVKLMGKNKFCYKKVFHKKSKKHFGYAVFRSDKIKNFKVFNKAVQSINRIEEEIWLNLTAHIAIGRSLGYSEYDIAAFIARNVRMKQFKLWQKNYENKMVT